MLELQSVAAMTEDMKEEYWARKRLENAPNPLMSNGKAARRMFLVFIGLIASVVAVGIMFGGNG
jgi:hypothetical protein